MGHPGTDPAVYDAVVEFARRIGMEPIKIHKEKAGYVLNSLLVPFLEAAQSLVVNGVADPETIDKTWRIATGAPKGPLQMLDIIGLTTAYNIAAAGDEQARANARYLKEHYIDQGKLGQAQRRRLLQIRHGARAIVHEAGHSVCLGRPAMPTQVRDTTVATQGVAASALSGQSSPMLQLPLRELGLKHVPAIPVDTRGMADTLSRLVIRVKQREQALQGLSKTFTIGGSTARAYNFLYGSGAADTKAAAAREASARLPAPRSVGDRRRPRPTTERAARGAGPERCGRRRRSHHARARRSQAVVDRLDHVPRRLQPRARRIWTSGRRRWT